MRQGNGLSNKGDAAHFEDIIHLNNHDNTTNGGRDTSESMATEAILTFDSEDSFMKKASPMKPQHVAGKFLKKIYIYFFPANKRLIIGVWVLQLGHFFL